MSGMKTKIEIVIDPLDYLVEVEFGEQRLIYRGKLDLEKRPIKIGHAIDFILNDMARFRSIPPGES